MGRSFSRLEAFREPLEGPEKVKQCRQIPGRNVLHADDRKTVRDLSIVCHIVERKLVKVFG